jgi:uncharacterized membrane protein
MAYEHAHQWQEPSFRDIQVTSSDIQIKQVALSDRWQSLTAGYEDYNAKPSFVPLLIIIYPLFGLLLTMFLVGENLLYLAFPMVAGATLLGPVVAVGFFEMSRRREAGLDLRWRAAFDFVHSARFAPVAALSLIMMVLYVAWLFMAEFIYFGLFGAAVPTSLSEFAREVTSTEHGAALILYGTLVGFLFAFTALAASVIAFPLILDRPVTSLTAISASFRAVTSNPVAIGVWGLIVVVLLAAGAALFLIGLAAVLPILGHATWHLYRRVVELG